MIIALFGMKYEAKVYYYAMINWPKSAKALAKSVNLNWESCRIW